MGEAVSTGCRGIRVYDGIGLLRCGCCMLAWLEVWHVCYFGLVLLLYLRLLSLLRNTLLRLVGENRASVNSEGAVVSDFVAQLQFRLD